jgi:ABC-type nickel/cobalt efflux system permease component RcnA
MFDTALGFSIMVSLIITSVIYVVNRDKNWSEQQQKDKMNDTIILFVITFIVVLFGKLCLSDQPSTVLVKAAEMKGGQCPF